MDRQDPESPSQRDPQRPESGAGQDPAAGRDVAHWVAVVFMTVSPAVLLLGVYLWLRSLNS